MLVLSVLICVISVISGEVLIFRWNSRLAFPVLLLYIFHISNNKFRRFGPVWARVDQQLIDERAAGAKAQIVFCALERRLKAARPD